VTTATSGWDMLFNPHTKLKVSMITIYKDMKGNTKCRNWGVFRWLGVTKDHW